MSIDRSDPALAFTLPVQLTRTLHRQPYAYILPEQSHNAQHGKIILVTGGGSGIGAVCGRPLVDGSPSFRSKA